VARIMSVSLVAAATVYSQSCGERTAPPAPTPLPDLASATNRIRLETSRVTLIVTRDQVRVNGQVVPLKDIYDKMRTVFSDELGSERAVTVEGAANAKYGTVLTVCDAAIHAGFFQLGLANRAQGGSIAGGQLPGFEEVIWPSSRGAWTQVIGSSHKSSLIGGKRPIEIVVTKDNEIWVEGKRSSNPAADVRAAVARHRGGLASGLSTHILLMADTDSDWGSIIKVLDAGRQAKDDDVGFATR